MGDVAAPGVNVLSSIPAAFCAAPPCFAFFQGTSMATPHLAGSAAVVKWLHPTWDAWQIRSAIVNTADLGVLTKYTNGTTILTDPNVIGAGRDDLFNAVTTEVTVDPVSVSFGAVPSISGQTLTALVYVTNVTGSTKTFGFTTTGSSGTGISYGVTSSLTLASGGSGWITVTMTEAKGSSLGDHNAWLKVWDGSEVAHAALYTFVKQ